MGIWSQLLVPAAPRATYSDWHDFWYRPIGPLAQTLSGVSVSPASALKTSAVWACVNLLSRTQAMLPAIVYRQREDGGKDRTPDHEVARIFRRRPNVWQSRFEFRQYGMVSVLLYGNYYAERFYSSAGRLAALVPRHPTRVTPVQLDSGRMGYTYRPPRGDARVLTQDDMFHVRGMSLDGIVGLSIIDYARETIGRSVAQEGAAASLYRNGMEARTVIQGPKLLSPTARESLKADLDEKRGYRNTGKTLLLEEGFSIEKLSMSARDSQFVESSYITIEDICRWFGVQPHLIAHLLRATFSNVEHQGQEYVTYSLMPWNVAWEAAAQRDLFEEDDDHFLEFLVDSLLRGDTLSRYQAYGVAIQNGIMSENEVRIRENLNPVEGLDEPRRSANQDRGGDPAGPRPQPPQRGQEDPEEPEEDNARAVVQRAAARLVRREVAALRRQADRGRLDRAWVTDFYGRHVDVLTGALCLTVEQARRYGADHCAALLECGVSVLGEWERTEPERLAALALRPQENGHHVHDT